MPYATTHNATEREARRTRIMELRKEGHTYEEIGKALGITSGTVGYYLNGRDPYRPKVTATLLKKDGTPRKPYTKRARIVSVLGSKVKPNGHAHLTDSQFKAAFMLGYEVGQLSTEERITLIQTLEGRE